MRQQAWTIREQKSNTRISLFVQIICYVHRKYMHLVPQQQQQQKMWGNAGWDKDGHQIGNGGSHCWWYLLTFTQKVLYKLANEIQMLCLTDSMANVCQWMNEWMNTTNKNNQRTVRKINSTE